MVLETAAIYAFIAANPELIGTLVYIAVSAAIYLAILAIEHGVLQAIAKGIYSAMIWTVTLPFRVVSNVLFPSPPPYEEPAVDAAGELVPPAVVIVPVKAKKDKKLPEYSKEYKYVDKPPSYKSAMSKHPQDPSYAAWEAAYQRAELLNECYPLPTYEQAESSPVLGAASPSP